jgi:ACS family glucarate transporter-like MFS transporter
VTKNPGDPLAGKADLFAPAQDDREDLSVTLSPCHPVTLSVQKPTHARYQVLAAACSLAVLTYVLRQGFVGGTPYIKEALGLDDEQVGYLASVWLVAYGIFQVPGGLLGDWFGGRHLLTILVLGWSLLTAAVALTVLFPSGGWWPFAFLIVLRFLFGALQAGGFPALARVLADWMPLPQRGFAQGLVWTFSRLGGALAPLLYLWLFRASGGWAPPFVLLAGLGLLWCAGFWPWFRNRPGEMRTVNEAERELIESGRPPSPPRGEGSKKGPLPLAERARVKAAGGVPWSRFLRTRNVWALCLMYGLVGFSGNFITSLLPVYLRGHRHLSDEATAWLSGLPLACGVVSCVLGGVLSDWLIRRLDDRKWGRRLVGLVSLVLAGLSVLFTPQVEEVWLLAVLFSAMFFFGDANMGPSWAACADVGERYAGTLSGAMNMVGAFLGAIGMAFAGYCFHRGWDMPVFIVFACSYGFASLCWLAVDVTKPLVPSDPSVTP